MKIDWNGWGYRTQIIKASERPIIGASINGVRFDAWGLDCSLINSLIASANGCGKPINPGLLGPLRVWKYPRNLRSIKV